MKFLNRFFFNWKEFIFKPRVAMNILGICYTVFLPKTQAIKYLSIVLKHIVLELACLI